MQSSIGADHGLGLILVLLVSPPACHAPHCQSSHKPRCYPQGFCHLHWYVIPLWLVKPLWLVTPLTCHTPYGAWRRCQQSTLAFMAKSLVSFICLNLKSCFVQDQRPWLLDKLQADIFVLRTMTPIVQTQHKRNTTLPAAKTRRCHLNSSGHNSGFIAGASFTKTVMWFSRHTILSSGSFKLPIQINTETSLQAQRQKANRRNKQTKIDEASCKAMVWIACVMWKVNL